MRRVQIGGVWYPADQMTHHDGAEGGSPFYWSLAGGYKIRRAHHKITGYYW